MDYKKIIRSQKARFFILGLLKWIPDSLMLKAQYYIKTGNKLSLTDPRRFTEWLQWYKINYRNGIMADCVDKYEVRKYVETKGLDEILNELYGIYDSAMDIDFDKIPDCFVAKTTNGGGGLNVIICKDKNTADLEDIKHRLEEWRKRKSSSGGREWAYSGIRNSRIIIERYLENKTDPQAGLEDYKILCFGGQPKVIIYDCDRYTHHKRNIYDTAWNRIYVESDCHQKDADIPKPKNLERMLEAASRLSEDFPFVRVDLYNLEGKIYFGELTFYPWSGYVKFNPDSFDFDLGAYWPRHEVLNS